jgi:hypothetical protein
VFCANSKEVQKRQTCPCGLELVGYNMQVFVWLLEPGDHHFSQAWQGRNSFLKVFFPNNTSTGESGEDG